MRNLPKAIHVRAHKDRLTKERRSWNISRIRGKNTTPEMRVRSLLHRLGYPNLRMPSADDSEGLAFGRFLSWHNARTTWPGLSAGASSKSQVSLAAGDVFRPNGSQQSHARSLVR